MLQWKCGFFTHYGHLQHDQRAIADKQCNAGAKSCPFLKVVTKYYTSHARCDVGC
jgi:hypothetical protein